ncbi:hypothetical protein [Clostridium botulinum]|uniref:hypothetical protein n=1 Tax=Clostridium botulinum TaxID=1491 RepID=UPI001C9B8D80|nr:hypothetical protein [Clostridium botulinum]MBY6918134.1 hypothetical protein [Clostridium botulinum]
MDELYNKLDAYYDEFGDVFPMERYTLPKPDIIKLIDKCIKNNKSINEIDPPVDDVIY